MNSRQIGLGCMISLVALLLAGCADDYQLTFESDADLSRYDAILVYPLFYEIAADGEATLLPPNPHSLFAAELVAEGGSGAVEGLKRDVHVMEKELLDVFTGSSSLEVFSAETTDAALEREGQRLIHCFLGHERSSSRVAVTLHLEDHLNRTLGLVRCEKRLADPAQWTEGLVQAARRAAEAFLGEYPGFDPET